MLPLLAASSLVFAAFAMAEQTAMPASVPVVHLAAAGDRQPPSAVAALDEHPLWDAHRPEILLGIAMLLLQAALIAGLLVQRARRRRVEAELHEYQQVMELATSAGDFGMWSRDLTTGHVWINPALRSLYGLSQSGDLNMSDLIAHVHPDDRARVMAAVQSAQEHGAPLEEEFRVASAGGGELWALVKGRTVADPVPGRPPRRMGVLIDITRRKEMERMLMQERAFLRQVIDVDPNFIFAKNRAGQFTLVNQAVADAFGATVENIVGKTDADFNPNAAEVEHFRRVDLAVMDTLQEQFIAEESITDAQGQTRWLQTVKRPIIDSDGRANQVLGSATDITRRKEVERELARQRSELAHLTRVSALGQLSASIAHQLNQPLAAILGNAEAARNMLDREPLDLAELREICDDIVSEDLRAAEVIRRLRDLYQRGEVVLAPLDVNMLVRDTLDLVATELSTRHVAVVTDLAPSLPPINAGRVQLQQVLLNLVLNAADAMHGNAENDRITMLRTERAGDGVQLAVVDRGAGIAASDLSKLFDAFWSNKPGGMGMGLAICKSIVAAHGGSIAATNNPDGGATFCVTLPARAAA